jgi:hypothetical protein
MAFDKQSYFEGPSAEMLLVCSLMDSYPYCSSSVRAGESLALDVFRGILHCLHLIYLALKCSESDNDLGVGAVFLGKLLYYFMEAEVVEIRSRTQTIQAAARRVLRFDVSHRAIRQMSKI